jgi:hypothetical protein
MTVLAIGGALVGAYLFKDQIMEALGGLTGGTAVPEETVVPEGAEEEGADAELSSRTIVIDYYAGRVAQSVTNVSTRNIYNWQEIKNVIIEKYIADVTAIAEYNKFEKKAIDENNMGSMSSYARLVLKVADSMKIDIKPTERKALMDVAGTGYTREAQERTIVKYIFNVPPPIVVGTVNPVIYYKFREYQIKRGWKPRPGTPKRVVFRNWKDLDKWYIIRYGHQRPTGTTLPAGCTIAPNGVITCVQSAIAYAFPEDSFRVTMT